MLLNSIKQETGKYQLNELISIAEDPTLYSRLLKHFDSETLFIKMEIKKCKSQATQSSMFISIPQLTHFLRIMIVSQRPNNTKSTRDQKKLTTNMNGTCWYNHTKVCGTKIKIVKRKYTKHNANVFFGIQQNIGLNFRLSFYDHRRHRIHLDPQQ